MVRVRFAPSPTGYLHVGGARTALFNWLFARKENGKFVLRIEDTDVKRSRREYEESLKDALKWLGLDWDEFYRQSDRLELYQRVAEKLVNEGKAYYVYAYPEEIEKIRERLLSSGKPPHYSGEMFEEFDTPERRKEYEEKGLRPAVFFRMPKKEYSFDDAVRGRITFKEGTIGDFAILRSNGLPTYNFAVVVDDWDMGITHVIRGDDHIPNTLRQLAIYEALGAEPPVFAHVSTILGPDGKKLSKRHGATSVEEIRDRGILPQALLNYLALLGWSHPKGKEILRVEEIIENFSLDRLNPNPAIFDFNKLLWMNSVYIRSIPLEELAEVSKPFLERSGLDPSHPKLPEILEAVRGRLRELSELPSLVDYFFRRPEIRVEFTEEERRVLEEFLKEMERLEWNRQSIVKAFRSAMKERRLKAREFFHRIRLALSGREEGVELEVMMEILGGEEVRRRLLGKVEGTG